MNHPAVRVVLAIFVGMLLGFSLAVGPAAYQQILDNRAVLEAMATDPVYQVIDTVESYNPRITVLNVMATEERRGGIVTMWLLHDTAGLTEDVYLEYLVDALANMYQALYKAYPGRMQYALIFASQEQVGTIEGMKVQIRAVAVYVMDPNALNSFLNAPTGDTLDALFARGSFVFQWVYAQNIALVEVLPRQPGHIWPWDIDDCNTCPN